MSLPIDKPGLILFVENYAECVRFYGQQIGLQVLHEQGEITTLGFGSGYLMIEKGGVANPNPKNRQQNPTVIRFNVQDVEAAAILLRRAGVAVQIEAYDWGVIGVFFDPDGNRCELKDPLPTAMGSQSGQGMSYFYNAARAAANRGRLV